MLRELNVNEMTAVSGGGDLDEIVVHGTLINGFAYDNRFLPDRSVIMDIGNAGGGGSGTATPPETPTTEDSSCVGHRNGENTVAYTGDLVEGFTDLGYNSGPTGYLQAFGLYVTGVPYLLSSGTHAAIDATGAHDGCPDAN